MSKLDYKDGFSLYVGIPFCPSVCSYCSFSSSPIAEWKDKVESYLFALLKEIRAIGKMSEGHRPDSVYIGGGTPTLGGRADGSFIKDDHGEFRLVKRT